MYYSGKAMITAVVGEIEDQILAPSFRSCGCWIQFPPLFKTECPPLYNRGAAIYLVLNEGRH